MRSSGRTKAYPGTIKGVEQTRTQSLFMCFWGERKLGVRLRGARGVMGRGEGKIASRILLYGKNKKSAHGLPSLLDNRGKGELKYSFSPHLTHRC